jgi:hypothetical protein
MAELDITMDRSILLKALKNAEDNNRKKDANKIANILAQQGSPQTEYNKAAESIRSFAGGALFEYGDELEAGLRTLVSSGRIGGKDYQKLRDELRAKQKAFAEENPKLALGTKIAGGFAIPGGVVASGATKGASLLKNIGIGSGYGALTGAGAAEEVSDIPRESLESGLIGGGVSGGISTLGRIIAPKLQKGAAELQKQGVQLTPGQAFGGTTQVIEQSAESIPVIGKMIKGSRAESFKEFNKAAVNKALEPINKQVSKNASGREIIREGQKILEDKYTELLPKLKFKTDLNVNASLNRIINNAKEDITDPGLMRTLQKQIDSFKSKTKNSISDNSLKRFEEDIKKKVGRYSLSTGEEKALGDALEDVQKVFEVNLQRQNKELAGELRNINKAYAGFARVETAMQRARGQDAQFTPESLAGAVSRLDKSARRRVSARGDAPLQDISDIGIDVLGSKVPDSGTPGRLLTTGLLGGGASVIDATTGGLLTLGSLPYTKGGRAVFNALIKQRPELIQRTGEGISDISTLLSSPTVLGIEEDVPTINIGSQQFPIR